MIWSCNEWLKKTYVKKDGNDLIRPMAHCKDGFSISIQAAQNACCRPRVTYGGPYRKVELRYPSEPEPLIFDYDYDPNDIYISHAYYPYTPVEVVDEIIKKHGGIEDGRIEN